MPAPLVDIGLNLAHKRFRKDLPAVVARAREAGVVHAVLTGTSVEGSRDAVALAEELAPWATATVGVHPHDVKHCDVDTIRVLEEIAASPACVAIGECGLDFDRDWSPRPVQEEWFEAQLELAARLGKPVFLHQRASCARLADILRPWMPRLPGAVVHCFTDGPEEARILLDLGCDLGVTGWICDDRRADAVRAAVPAIPADRLMIETDAPYLTPRDLRRDEDGHSPVPGVGLNKLKSRNEPALLPWVCAAVARFAGRPADQVARESSAVAARFFGLDLSP